MYEILGDARNIALEYANDNTCRNNDFYCIQHGQHRLNDKAVLFTTINIHKTMGTSIAPSRDKFIRGIVLPKNNERSVVNIRAFWIQATEKRQRPFDLSLTKAISVVSL